jgi:succinate-semialdehyde dehydrogenase/glutarate-semialdehyde dehydrogenase
MKEFVFRKYVNGQWRDANHGGVWDLVNPATEEMIGAIPFGDASDARDALDFASAAFPKWSRMTPYERGDVLYRAAEWILARVDDLAVITTEESGKPLRESAE